MELGILLNGHERIETPDLMEYALSHHARRVLEDGLVEEHRRHARESTPPGSATRARPAASQNSRFLAT
jgi:hypothetical protein